MTITPQRENGLWALCCPAPGSCLTHRTFSTALGGCILPVIQRGQRRLREVSMLKVTLLVGGQSQAAHWSEPPGPAPVPLGDSAWVSRVHSAAPGEEGWREKQVALEFTATAHLRLRMLQLQLSRAHSLMVRQMVAELASKAGSAGQEDGVTQPVWQKQRCHHE